MDNKEHHAKMTEEYRETHKTHLALKAKEYREKNKETIELKKREYYQQNRDDILLKGKQTHTCACGKTYTIQHKARHEKTTFHKKHEKR